MWRYAGGLQERARDRVIERTMHRTIWKVGALGSAPVAPSLKPDTKIGRCADASPCSLRAIYLYAGRAATPHLAPLGIHGEGSA